MVRAAAKHFQPLLASLNSFVRGQGFAQYAVPAVALPKAGGFLGGSKRVMVPLSEPLPNVNIPNPASPKAPELQTGSLEGGIKAACLDSTTPNTSVAVFVGGGAAAETAETAGASKLLEYMAFSATKNRTTFRITRELEKYGAASSCVAGREHIGYVVETTKLQAAEATELLLDVVLNQKLADWEVADMLETVQADLDSAYADPIILARELLHKAAFSGGLANSLLPDPAEVGGMTGAVLRQYMAANFVPSNIAIAAAGLGLDQLKQITDPLLHGVGGAASASSSSTYTGGFLAALSPGAEPTVAVAFEAKGGLSSIKSTATAAVVKALLGSDSRHVLPYQDKALPGPVTSLTPLVQMYNSTGLIGLMATTTDGSAVAAADALTVKLQGAAKAAGDVQLAAAKQVALGGYQSAISAQSGVVQDMGLQLLSRGKFSAQEYASAVSSLTAADVAKYIEEALKTPLTLVAVGSMSNLPKYDTVKSRLAA
jgi:processing peptidase subunit alpha